MCCKSHLACDLRTAAYTIYAQKVRQSNIKLKTILYMAHTELTDTLHFSGQCTTSIISTEH